MGFGPRIKETERNDTGSGNWISLTNKQYSQCFSIYLNIQHWCIYSLCIGKFAHLSMREDSDTCRDYLCKENIGFIWRGKELKYICQAAFVQQLYLKWQVLLMVQALLRIKFSSNFSPHPGFSNLPPQITSRKELLLFDNQAKVVSINIYTPASE